MRRLWPLCLLAAVAGCVTNQPGVLVAEFKPGEPSEVRRAPQSATYVLRKVSGPAAEPTTQLTAQVNVYEGSPIGFARRNDGKLTAVAGEQRLPLADGRYQWVADSLPHTTPLARRAVADQTRQTIEDVGGVVAMPFVAGLYLAMMPLVLLGLMPRGSA